MIAPLPARRVHVLRLAAPDETLAHRGAILLEDALRTASLPEGDGGRLIVIRSMNIGRINSAWSPGSVALAVEQRWRELGAGAVYAETPAAADGPAVYFRDRADAVTLLALRLARGADVSAWFWPLVVPGWQPGLTGSEAHRRVLAAALALPAAVAALLSLLAALHEAAALATFLDALRPADGPALLAACGWAHGEPDHTVEPAATAAPTLSSHGRAELARAVSRWGAADARSAWLAAAILAIEVPGRLLDSRLADQAARLARAVGQSSSPARAEPVLTREPEPASESELLPPRTKTQHDPGSPATGSGPAALLSIATGGRQLLSSSSTTVETVQAAPAEASALDAEPGPEAAPHTRFAGLFLLLPLLARLGIAGLIEANPHLAEPDLPGRILRDAARRLRIPSADPALAALRPAPRWTGDCPFLAPAAWQTALVSDGPWVLRPVAGRPGTRVLCDASGRLATALWHGRPPDVVRERLRGEASARVAGNLRRGSALARRSDPAILLDAWAVAIQRWLAAYTGIPLGALVRRPGVVAATRTHLDVTFAHRSVDIRIRRAGLDLDPGWLPWFGRVVLYHYVAELPS